jgi:hypothetical protein
MHKLIGAACRRTAGVTAGVILTGGLVGGVLLTPGTAYAAGPTAVGTTTTVSATATSASVNVDVTVTAASGTVSPTGNVYVHGMGGGCSAGLSAGSAGASTGSCSISLGHVQAGTYTLNARYEGSGSFGSSSGTGTVTISPAAPTGPTGPTGPTSGAPVFTAADPPSTATDGQSYSYGFHADGCSGLWYALGGAPGWMQINQQTGMLWGTVPSGGSSFGYSVTAWCGKLSVTRWFRVDIRQFFYHRANISTFLNCTSPVFTGQRGTCTLWVSNRGYSSVSNVAAQIALPPQLRADYCGYFYSFNYGCSIYGNTAYQNLGSLYPGQTKSLTVVFTARNGFYLFGWHHGFRFTVKVVGSASSYGYFGYFGNRSSYSAAYVTIIPRGHWW